jgi:hypothetical protein
LIILPDRLTLLTTHTASIQPSKGAQKHFFWQSTGNPLFPSSYKIESSSDGVFSTHDLKKFEKQFFDALRDIFFGTKVEGDSGYINLMRIKSRYYEQGVFPQLRQDINAALQPFPDFREELVTSQADYAMKGSE